MTVNARNAVALSGVSAINGIAKATLSAINGETISGGSGGSITVVQAIPKGNLDGIGSGSSTVTAPGSFTAGNTGIVTFVHWSDAGAPGSMRITGVTIGGTAATKRIEQDTSDSDGHTEIWIATNMTGGTANIVFTYTGGGGNNYVSYGGLELSGMSATPNDLTGTLAETSTATPGITHGTLAQSVEIIIITMHNYGADLSSVTPPTGYTSIFTELASTGHESGFSAYKITSSNAGGTPQFTLNAARPCSGVLATFKAA